MTITPPVETQEGLLVLPAAASREQLDRLSVAIDQALARLDQLEADLDAIPAQKPIPVLSPIYERLTALEKLVGPGTGYATKEEQ